MTPEPTPAGPTPAQYIKNRAIEVLTNCAQLFDGKAQEGVDWSEWDRGVRRDIGEVLEALISGDAEALCFGKPEPLLAASTGARGAVVEEIAKRHEADEAAIQKQAYYEPQQSHYDRATLLALIGAKQP